MFFNGSAQRTIMVSGIMPFRGDASTGDRNVMQFIANDYWSEANPNPDARFPRLGITDSQVANNSDIVFRTAVFISMGITWLCGVLLKSGIRNYHGMRILFNGLSILEYS